MAPVVDMEDPKNRLRRLLLERPDYRDLYMDSTEFRCAVDAIVNMLPLLLKTAAEGAEEAAKMQHHARMAEHHPVSGKREFLSKSGERIIGKHNV